MSSSIRTRLRTLVAAALVGALALALVEPAASTGSMRARSGDPPQSAVPTVKRWLNYLENGKSRKAWKLIAKPSRRTVGSFNDFKNESSAWAEGWGAWASARKRDFELRAIAPMDDDADSVVTMTGRVALEGPFRLRAAALPVQTRDGLTKVDPAHGNAVVRIARPSGGQTIGRRTRLKAVVKGIRPNRNSVYFMVKDSKVAPTRARLEKIGRRAYRATLRWPRKMSPGRHVLSVASWGQAGFKADAVRFKVRK